MSLYARNERDYDITCRLISRPFRANEKRGPQVLKGRDLSAMGVAHRHKYCGRHLLAYPPNFNDFELTCSFFRTFRTLLTFGLPFNNN
jgi:hypothetical protein